MWKFIVFVLFAASSTAAQKSRTSAHQDHSGRNWDIRLAVPGEPGNDYPTLGNIPRTSFSCAGKAPGYYADLETNCQAFRVCTLGSTYGFQSFLCPNGTLFNQAVFVCDWWMNVNCQASERLFNNNNEKFGRLRLGPQLMKDVKKMITHPMRNPYDRNAMKSNVVVMQDYKPPYGQFLSNEALTTGPERSTNNVYVPAKQVQFSGQNYNNGNDIAFAASTPNPRYIPAAFSSLPQMISRDSETYQGQRQNNQFVQSNNLHSARLQQQNTNRINGHAGQLQSNPMYPRPTQNFNNRYPQQKLQSNIRTTSSIGTQNAINYQRGQLNQQFSQYNNNNQNSIHNKKQMFAKQIQYNPNQDDRAYEYNQPQLRFSNDITGKAGNEAKENLVSLPDNDVLSTVVTKTVTLKQIIQEPKSVPKSRITIKTWIVKPSKSAKLVNPTPYTYEKPSQSPTQKLIATTPYVYNKPIVQLEKNIAEGPYVYNKPTTPAKQVKPPRIISTTTTTPQPTLSRLYLSPTSAPPTQASRLYLAPTTYNPSSRYYLPPSEPPIVLSRQYLAPSIEQLPPSYESEQLRASPSTPSPFYALPNTETVSSYTYSKLKQSQYNNGHKNLTFTDILTKTKLDNTVSDIVKDTSSFLKTAAPAEFEELRDLNSVDYSEDFPPPEPTTLTTTDSGESLTALPPETNLKSSRLISSPSVDLEPPVETLTNNENSNQISSLPFLKESLAPTNTIERTVSLKISIPEKIASFLFKNNSDSDFDKLEILNTGSSNYLVLTNNYLSRNKGTSFIPIGKLISDKQSNISNSQALVFSLLADSINIAKEYNRAHQETVQTLPTQQNFQNINNDELADITSKISQLTSSQYSGNVQGNYKSANLVSTAETFTNNGGYQYNGLTMDRSNQNKVQTYRNEQYKLPQSNQHKLLNDNSKQIYSGQLYQLPVPDVSNQILNSQSNSAKQIQSFNIGSSNHEKSLKSDVEIVKSQTIPNSSSAKLQEAPVGELDDFNSQENFNKFVKSNTGISAQLRDKIVGTIPHPLEDNKLVTYKKDESFYVYTKLDNNLPQNIQGNSNNAYSINKKNQESARLVDENNVPNIVAFQLIPSISYQVEDEKDQQKLLNAFRINEFGSPKQKANLIDDSNQSVVTSNVDFSVDHTTITKKLDKEFNDGNTLYAGPSSYSAPQKSVGRLSSRQEFNSRLEIENDDNGYSKVTPSRQFTFK